jgi:ATP-dependent RNA helicase DHX29
VGQGDRDLSEISHIIVDEVHERTVLGDFLLVILKDLLERRRANGSPPLKLILMSATLDSNLFSSYFGNCPVISAKGRTFPVTTFFLENIYEQLDYRLASDSPAAFLNSSKGYSRKLARNVVDSNRGRQDLVNSGWGDETKLEQELRNPLFDIDLYHSFSEKTRINLERVNEDVIDYELLEDLIIHIDEDCEAGAVLVFLPGMAEIQLMKDRLSASRRFSGSASEWLLPLHSSVASSDQRRVFQRPPSGNRKIVLATNIAETSITIDDVVHVIDCGKHKENRFDPRRVPSLVPFSLLLWRVVWGMHFVDVSIVWMDVLPGIIFCQLCFDAGDVEHG